MVEIRCPECKSDKIVLYDMDEIVCDNCGLVLYNKTGQYKKSLKIVNGKFVRINPPFIFR